MPAPRELPAAARRPTVDAAHVAFDKAAVANVTGSSSRQGRDENAKDDGCRGGAWQPENVARGIVTVLTRPGHVRVARLLVVPVAQPV